MNDNTPEKPAVTADSNSSTEKKENPDITVGGTPQIPDVFRQRVGTLLRADNVSFLLGAGASIEAGGPSMAKISSDLNAKLSEEDRMFGCVKRMLKDEECSRNPGLQDTTSSEEKTSQKENAADDSFDFEALLEYLYLIQGAMGSAEQITIKSNANVEISSSGTDPGNTDEDDSQGAVAAPDAVGDEDEAGGGSAELTINKTDLASLIAECKAYLHNLVDSQTNSRSNNIDIHKTFLRRILARPTNLRRSNIFTLNYDTLIERAADAEGVYLVDGFVGNLTRVFRPESFEIDYYYRAETAQGNAPLHEKVARLFKLHGSLTWRKTSRQSWENPFGLVSKNSPPASQDKREGQPPDDTVMIYPTPLKAGLSNNLPYSELFRRFGNAITRQQSVLFAIGYGFGDEHVNAIIRQALTIPSFILVIVDPAPAGQFIEELKQARDDRVCMVAGESGKFSEFVSKVLPNLHEDSILARIKETYAEIGDEKKESSRDQREDTAAEKDFGPVDKQGAETSEHEASGQNDDK